MERIRRIGEYNALTTEKTVLGSFIESGYGRQVKGMWAEMLENRSFRRYSDYKYPTWQWLGLDRDHYNENAPFWHSGYEEEPWKPVGNPELERTLGEETFKGKSSLLVKNAGGVCGLSQAGLHLKAGREYEFRVFCGVSSGRLSVNGANSDFGGNARAADARPLRIRIGGAETVFNVGGDPSLHSWTFTAPEDGVFTLSLTFEWAGTLILSWTSLMPRDTLKGWRWDVVERIREAGPTVVRFPGGCFTSVFDWRASIGPREEREPVESFYWGGLEENDVGLAEFLELSRLCSFEPQICFNMMTSSPFEARCMVEYLNAPADVGYGRRRMLDGYPDPWNVRLFECDNEAYRKWNPVQYAQQCVAFIREMRLASPDAQFMMLIQHYDPEAIPEMLEIAGGDVDYVTHRGGDPETVSSVLAVLRRYNETHGRNIRLTNTEWCASCASPEPFDEPGIDQNYRWDGVIRNDYDKTFSRHQLSWNYALNGAHQILNFASYGGEFYLANFNNMANTFGQNLIEASKDGAWLSCMGEVFAFFRRCAFAPCHAAQAETGDGTVFALFTKDGEERERLWVVNHSGSEKAFRLPDGCAAALDGLTAAKRSVFVTETEKPVRRVLPAVRDGVVVLPPLFVGCFGGEAAD